MTRAPVNLYMEEQAAGIRRTEPADTATSNGGLVDAVLPGSPADEAGIRPGARVLAANGGLGGYGGGLEMKRALLEIEGVDLAAKTSRNGTQRRMEI